MGEPLKTACVSTCPGVMTTPNVYTPASAGNAMDTAHDPDTLRLPSASCFVTMETFINCFLKEDWKKIIIVIIIFVVAFPGVSVIFYFPFLRIHNGFLHPIEPKIVN